MIEKEKNEKTFTKLKDRKKKNSNVSLKETDIESEIPTNRDNFNDYCLNKMFSEGTPVYLNIYHLTSLNNVLQLIGIGIYHTTIEIKRNEYSFGGTNGNRSGIYIESTESTKLSLNLKEKKYLGNTIFSEDEIRDIISLSSPFWQGNSYDPFIKNCNHFTKYFSEKILLEFQVEPYPSYINRFTEYSVNFSIFYNPIKRIYIELENEKNKNKFNALNEEFFSLKNNSKYNNTLKNNEISNSENKKNGTSIISINEEKSSEIKKAGYILDKINQLNFFIFPFLYEGSNLFLKNLSTADRFMYLENKKEEAFKIYEFLLSNYDKQNMIILYEEFSSFFPNEITNLNVNSYNDIVKIKILYSKFYYYLLTDDFNGQNGILKEILKIYNKDFFAFFYLAYINFIDNKIPECVPLLKNSLKFSKDECFNSLINYFLNIIEKQFI